MTTRGPGEQAHAFLLFWKHPSVIRQCTQLGNAQLVPSPSPLPHSFLAQSGGFLWSVFVNTHRGGTVGCCPGLCGMPGEAAPCTRWQSWTGGERVLWQSADHSAGHAAIYEDVIGVVVNVGRDGGEAGAAGWGVKPDCPAGAGVCVWRL